MTVEEFIGALELLPKDMEIYDAVDMANKTGREVSDILRLLTEKPKRSVILEDGEEI